MKNDLKTLTLMLFLAFEFTPQLYAQQEYVVRMTERKKQISPAGVRGTPVYLGDKNHLVSVLETDFPKVAKAFVSQFPGAAGPLWIREGETLFVYFINYGNKVSAQFTTGGYMNYAVTHIHTSSVPFTIKRKIRSGYRHYSIFSIKQIRAGNYIAYEVVLENKDGYVVIHTDEEEIVATDTIRKPIY